MRARAGQNVCARRFVSELDILNPLSAAHDLVGRYQDLPDIAVCLAEVLFVLAPILALSQGLEHIVILGDAINPWLRAFHIVGWVLMAGVVLLIVAAVRFVRLPGHGLWFRAHAILLAIGGIAFGVFAWQYNLLDASLKF